MLRKILGLFVSVALLMGCAHTRIIVQDDGTYLALSHSPSETRAYDSALDDAQDYCHGKGRQFAMVGQQSKYQGMDKTAKGVVNAVALATGSHGAYYGTSSRDDYKVELHFRCK